MAIGSEYFTGGLDIDTVILSSITYQTTVGATSITAQRLKTASRFKPRSDQAEGYFRPSFAAFRIPLANSSWVGVIVDAMMIAPTPRP